MPEGARRRRWPVVLIVLAAVLAVLVVAWLVADAVARSYAEGQVRSQIAANVPGAEADDVSVQIGGGAFLPQYFGGTLDDVRVRAQGVELGGQPIDVAVHAVSVPVDASEPIASATGSARISATSLQALLTAAGHEGVTLGDGTVSYQVQRTVLGIPLTFTVTATPEATGEQIVFHPTGAALAAGSVAIDVSGVIDTLVSSDGLSVCVASELPHGVSIDAVAVSPDAAVVRFSAHDVAIADLSTPGTCP